MLEATSASVSYQQGAPIGSLLKGLDPIADVCSKHVLIEPHPLKHGLPCMRALVRQIAVLGVKFARILESDSRIP